MDRQVEFIIQVTTMTPDVTNVGHAVAVWVDDFTDDERDTLYDALLTTLGATATRAGWKKVEG
jgi:hypothetical protein